jgi:hypothetical protein
MRYPDVVYRLKSLYGLKQAGRSWYRLIRSILVALDFTPTPQDKCVFVKRMSEHGLQDTYLVVHVDDMLLINNNRQIMEEFIAALNHHLKQVKVNRETEQFEFLGVTIDRERKNRRIRLNQHLYIKQLVEQYLPSDEPTTKYPIDTDAILEDHTDIRNQCLSGNS